MSQDLTFALDIGGSGARGRIGYKGADGTIRFVGETVRLPGFTTRAELIEFITNWRGAAKAVVCASSGTIIDDTTVLKNPSLPCMDEWNLAGSIQAACGVPAMVFNDMVGAGYGMYAAAGRPSGLVIAITMSTGEGVRPILDGEMPFSAVEAGHTVIDTSALADVCTCGGYGHIETYLGGDRLRERIMRHREWRLHESECESPGNPWDFLTAQYAVGEAWAIKMIDYIAFLMGVFLYNVMAPMADVKMLLIKGSVGRNMLKLAGFQDKVRAVIQSVQLPVVHTVPFRLIPDDIDQDLMPDDDTFLGCVYLAEKYLGIGA